MTVREDEPVPTDDAIREMIEARAGRAGLIRFDASVVAARAVRDARTQPSPPSLLPRLAIAVASVAAAVVLAVVIALPLGSRPASAPPSNVSSAPIDFSRRSGTTDRGSRPQARSCRLRPETSPRARCSVSRGV